MLFSLSGYPLNGFTKWMRLIHFFYFVFIKRYQQLSDIADRNDVEEEETELFLSRQLFFGHN